jgi:GTP-binding protein
VQLKVQAGNGGSGCLSFHRDRKVRTGANDGGDGGKGGDLYLKASPRLRDLHIFKKKKVTGNNGKGGRPKGQDGREGKDIHSSVPVGTMVYEVLNNT